MQKCKFYLVVVCDVDDDSRFISFKFPADGFDNLLLRNLVDLGLCVSVSKINFDGKIQDS